MARIRTIKPDFWKSESISVFPKDTRLTFIGLWTYVDDNGVGLDNEKLIVAELYPLEEDPREALASVREDLARLAAHGRIVRYTVAGKAFLEIVNWSEHQRIDRPGKPRYPTSQDPAATILTCENVANPEGVDFPKVPDSRDPRETFARSHLLEQGTGNREQGKEHAASASLQPPPLALVAEIIEETTTDLAIKTGDLETANAGQILGAWIDYCANQSVILPKRIKGQYAKTIKENLDSGVDPEIIKRALASMLADGVAHQPSWLASRIVAVQTGPERRRRTSRLVEVDGMQLTAANAEAYALVKQFQDLEAQTAIGGTT